MSSTGESTAVDGLRCTIDADLIQAEFSVMPDRYGEWNTHQIEIERVFILGRERKLKELPVWLIDDLREWAAENGDWR